MSHNITESKTFCPLAWLGSNFTTQHEFLPCCHGATDIDHTIDTKVGQGKTVNHNSLNGLRQSIMQGHKHSFCKRCWQEESVGADSGRLEAIAQSWWKPFESLINQTPQSGEFDHDPVFMDVKLDNTCNLACRHCSPISSSLHEKEIHDHINQFNSFWPQRVNEYHSIQNISRVDVSDRIINNKNLRVLKFTGGEPLLNPNMMPILNALIHSQQSREIDLEVTTNGLVVKDDFVEASTQFRSVKMRFSLEAVGNTYNYLRWPGRWNRFLDKIELVRSHDHINLGFCVSVHCASVFYLDQLLHWFSEQFPQYQFVPSFVFEPEHLDIKHLPNYIKQMIINKLTDFADTPGVQSVIKQMMKARDRKIWEEFLVKIKLQDQIRNQKMLDFMPEFAHLTDFHKTL